MRQEFTDLSSIYQERRMNYDKVGVGLDLERQTLEKDCGFFQVLCCFNFFTYCLLPLYLKYLVILSIRLLFMRTLLSIKLLTFCVVCVVNVFKKKGRVSA